MVQQSLVFTSEFHVWEVLSGGRGGMILTSFEDAGNLKDKIEGLLAELQGSLAAVHTPLGFELLGVGKKGPQYQCIVS